MTKIAISSDLDGLPWQHQMHDGNFKHVSMYIGIFSFSCEQNIKTIKVWDISQNLRPNMGLIDLCCGCSLESPRRGDSNEHPQHRFL